jgi:hypothetical protein
LTNADESRRARVFISCGQNKKSDEVVIAGQIRDRLTELGFDAYVAVEQQSLLGLKESIFRQLENSEYFVFVDFKREQLDGISEHRGSLFAHQELAVASFLNLPVIVMQEKGVKPDDGILRFLQGNAITFSARPLLPGYIADQVHVRGWDKHLRNELVMARNADEHSDANLISVGKGGRYFHVSVRNCHSQKTANNCYVYLQRATRLNPTVEIPLPTRHFGRSTKLQAFLRREAVRVVGCSENLVRMLQARRTERASTRVRAQRRRLWACLGAHQARIAYS